MLDSSLVLRMRGLRESLNVPWKQKSVPPCRVFPLPCPDVNCHCEPQLQQSKPLCCSSLLRDTWKQPVCFPPQKEPCGCSAHETEHMFLVDSVSVFRMHSKARLDSLPSLFLPALPALIESTKCTETNDSDSLAASRAKSAHLSQLTCLLLDMHWDGFITITRWFHKCISEQGSAKEQRIPEDSDVFLKDCSQIEEHASNVT